MNKVKSQEELRKELSESLKESKRPIIDVSHQFESGGYQRQNQEIRQFGSGSTFNEKYENTANKFSGKEREFYEKNVDKDLRNMQKKYNISDEQMDHLKKTPINNTVKQPTAINERNDKIDSKLEKIDSKLEKVETKTDKQSDKKEKARSSLKDRRVRFSGEVVGERTLATKVVTSPQKALSYSVGKLRTELEKEIHDSEMVGLELGQKGMATASKLKSASVSVLNKKVGFDRKAHNLSKSNKEENKSLRKEARKKTQQRKQIRKKAKVQGKMYEGSVLDRVINFFKRDKKDTSESTKSFAPQLIIGIVLSVLLLITPVLVMIPMAGLGGIGSPTTEAFGFESAIDIPIDIEGYSYQAGNPYVPAGYRGQCTWFVWGRVHEVYDIRIPANLGDGGQWYDSVLNDSRFTVGDEPAIGSIGVFGGSQFGHVAFVENYDPDTKVVTFSEGNIGNPMSGTSGMVPYARTHYAELVREGNNWTLSNTRWDATLIGFIYIDPEKWE